MLSTGLTIYLACVCTLAGLACGSFCNAWAWRLARGESIVRGRSQCPACGHTLAARDLVPLFSWLALRGRCRFCDAPISARYPVSEAVCGLAFLSLFLRYGICPETPAYLVLAALLLTLSLVDLETCIIPDRFLVLAALDFVVLTLCTAADRMHALLSGLVHGLILAAPILLIVLIADRVLGRESMGGGDIKLFFVLGLFLQPLESLLLVLFACAFGLLFAALPALRGPDRVFPFGPALCLAMWAVLLAGAPIVQWYLHLF